jgi:hypothetical protein
VGPGKTCEWAQEKLMSGPRTIEKEEKYIYDEIKTTVQYVRVFYDGWLRINNKLSVRNLVSILLFY